MKAWRWLSLGSLLTFALPVFAQADASGEATGNPPPTPALSLALAILSTILVLFIVCSPSRKA